MSAGREAQRALAALRLVLILVALLAGAVLLRKHVSTAENGRLTVNSDILSCVEASRAMREGADIYHRPGGERNSYVYPPFFAFFLIPATFVHPLAVDIAWYLLNIVLLVCTLSWAYTLFTGTPFRTITVRQKVLFAVLPSVLGIRYIVRNAQDANVNLVLLALILGGVLLLERRKDPRWAALPGIAAAIKVLPAILLLYFLVGRKWREAVWMAAAAATATVLPVLWMGPEPFLDALTGFATYASHQFSAQGLPIENFSFWGLAGRLLTPVAAFAGTDGRDVAVNLADIDLAIVRRIIMLLHAAILLWFAWSLDRNRRAGGDTAVVPYHGGLVLTLLLMNLLSVLIQDHHTVSYVTAMQFLLVGALGSARRDKRVLGAVVACGLVSTLMSYDVLVPLAGKDAYFVLLSWSLPVLPVGVLLAVLTARMLSGRSVGR
jgi:hypothetical protein